MRVIKRKPTHPGQILKEDYLEPLDLTITELSKVIGTSRKTLSKIVNGRGSVTPEMALKLSKAFDTSPEFWLNLQRNYDLWEATQKSTDWQSINPLVKSFGQISDISNSLKKTILKGGHPPHHPHTNSPLSSNQSLPSPPAVTTSEKERKSFKRSETWSTCPKVP